LKQIIILISTFICCFIQPTLGQNKLNISAEFFPELNKININQKITITNTTQKGLDSIYLSDWNNSYSSKKTDLAIRFAEEYSTKLHFSNEKEKGFTNIKTIKLNNFNLKYIRTRYDIISVLLNKTLQPNEKITLNLEYVLQLPSDKFSRFGIDNKKNVKLKEWFLIPAKLTDTWQYYSNKDLDDLYFPNSDITIGITIPKKYDVISDLDFVDNDIVDQKKTITLSGENRISTELHITTNSKFSEVVTEKLTIVSNIDEDGIGKGLKAIIHDKVAFFLNESLGDYPHKKILLSNASYKRNPVYGLNQLPDFIRPFPDGFQYEIKIVKAAIAKYIKNTFNTNPRKDYWLNDSIESYLMAMYIKRYYPNVKLMGTLSNIWGIKSFEIAKKGFNDQYYYFSQYTARKNLDQKLSSSKDSLLKYNVNISNKNRAGVGLLYLDDYLGNNIINESISEFYKNSNTKTINSKSFVDFVQSKTSKDISWFLDDYINSNKKIDYTIKQVTEDNNKLIIRIKNKEKSRNPISIYQIKDNRIINKEYIEGFENEKTIKIVNNKPDRVILNYEGIIPEFNLRDNTKKIKPHIFNKPLKFGFIKDSEAPNHSQLFYVPELGYNLYDGLSPGITLTNKTLLRKNFTYKIKPIYGLKSKSLVGSISSNYTKFYKHKDLFSITYGLSYNQYHYEEDLMYQKFNPYVIFNFRDKKNLRDNANKYIIARNVTVQREKSLITTDNTPNYNIFNLKAGLSDANLLNLKSLNTDIQFAKDFGKISVSYEYRKTFDNNRQLNLRTFAGGFIYNNTNSDFFSYSLDRPQDYLFDYNYYGRSESTGIYSQQIIIAEGGFKSKLNTPLANQWMTTANASTTIWKYIFAYGDIGVVSNKNNVNVVYDSGIHVNLVPDYFELYFPVYSTLGWEISQPRYADKIRFKITLSPKILIKLFTRKWL
jgi:hypothetical protein